MGMKHLAILASLVMMAGTTKGFYGRVTRLDRSGKDQVRRYGKRWGLNQRQKRKLARQTQNF